MNWTSNINLIILFTKVIKFEARTGATQETVLIMDFHACSITESGQIDVICLTSIVAFQSKTPLNYHHQKCC